MYVRCETGYYDSQLPSINTLPERNIRTSEQSSDQVYRFCSVSSDIMLITCACYS
jgi:hypothetical protein